jgi:YVTN family beta-propeller protein
VTQRPRGTVTFLFTDVEGSTRLLKLLRDRYGSALAEHQRLLREAFAAHGGEEVDTQGDAFFYVFARARDAAAGAADGQRALAAHAWPDGAEFRVRMGMHTGEPDISDEGRYHGMGVHRTARLMAAGHGGQILASQATASVLADDELDGITLRDLGEHKLKDLARPERIFELQVEGLEADFPPLTTESAAQAPSPLYRRSVVVGALAGVVAAAIAIAVFAFDGGSGGSSLSALSANSVGVVDPASGAIEDEILDIQTPTRIAAGEDAIWVTSSQANSVYRIDADSHELRQTLRVGDGPTGIALGGDDVWVANTLAGTVSRIDPAANEVVGDPIRVGNGPTAVAFGEGSIWVTNVDDGTVSRIHPNTGEVVATIVVDAAGRGLVVGGGAVWISDSASNRVVRVDPKTNDVTQAIGVGSGPSAVAFGAGSVWVASTLDGTISRIDPVTNGVRATVAVGASPVSIATRDDVVWVANETARTIVRLDPRTTRVEQTVRTGARPTSLALADALWVAGQASEGTQSGGRLLVDMADVGKERDPANAYDYGTWNILNITNDGLVGFKNVGGAEGAQVVPNLATSLPTPTDGGKTYAFRLRRGLRYSTGALMKASDVRSTFERLFRSGLPDYFSQLVGGAECLARPKTCDLSTGIVTDDTAGTVIFHLTAPDAEFLYKLATPFGSVLPAETRVSKGGTRPVPATGPYEIRGSSSSRLRLVRNPYFHVWDPVARPAGYPNEIIMKLGPPTDQAASDVARGRADVATRIFFTPRVKQFATQHPAQVRTTPAATTFFWFVNTREPPFDDVRARRAVNYMIDRSEFVDILGGPEAAQPACQVLPPNFPGYRPYCPYTLSPDGGAWSAPDPTKALELVRASGTAGARVMFWMPTDIPNATAVERFARRTFTKLGYRFSARRFPGLDEYYGALGATRRTVPESGINAWAADYPAASNFFETLTCASAADKDTANLSRFCSPSIDREIARARRLQAVNQAAASKLWAKIDRETTDRAAWVSTVTPRNVDLVSKRVGNFQRHPLFGVLLDQLWVR